MKYTIHKTHLFLILGFLYLLLGVGQEAKAQYTNFPDTTGQIRMPVGYVRVGDENLFGLRLQPELRLWKLGVGLDIPIFFSLDDGSFRNEEYRNGSGLFRLFRYIRWGRKEQDKVYFRIGSLDYNYLGFGYLMNNYTNAPSFERRKVGFDYDIRFRKIFGLEGTITDLSGFSNLWSFRPYIQPFVESNIPILKSLEIGFSYITDHDKNEFNASGARVDTRLVREGISAIGADLGLKLLESDFVTLNSFFQFGRLTRNQALADSLDAAAALCDVIDTLSPEFCAAAREAADYDAANGFSLGLEAKMKVILNVLNIDVRLERLFQDAHFQPQFFDAVYEIDKDAKIASLANTARVNGTYGALTATVLNKLTFIGGLRIPDQVSAEKPALVHLGLQADDFIPKVIFRAYYVKGDLDNLGDAFRLDERSLLTARAAYRITSYLVAGVDYRWTFAQFLNDDGGEAYKATRYIMPYFGFNYPLGKKKK